MAFTQSEIGFEPGLYGNRSKRASKGRWVDGDLVRFRDGPPAQVGGWKASPFVGVPIAGRARDMIAWRPNNGAGRYCAIGTHSNAYQFDGGAMIDITPTAMTVGRPDSIIGAGYGAGLYGDENYGTPRTTSSNLLDASVWTFDMFGEVLLGCFTGDGVIYRYQPGADLRLVPLTNAPSARAICVTDERIVFAFGCDGKPNLVRWSDRENPTVWTPAPANRAGFYEMQATSAFQCGKRARGQVLAWTQTELFGFSPLANSLVYSRDRLGSECGVMGPHASSVVTMPSGETAIWMGSSSFFLYDGLVRKLDCALQDYVFKDVNLIQRAKVQARHNSMFGEVWFWYPSAGSNEIDRAVIYNYENGTWSKASVARLSWADRGVFPLPLAIDQNGVIYEHENGDSANGVPMGSYVLSHPLTVGVGQQMMQLCDFWPDMEPMSDDCTLTIVGRYYSGAPDELFGPYPFDAGTEKIDLSIEVRQAQIKIAGISGYWELGAPILNIQPGSLR
jgi:hypothetical protein